VAVLPALFVVSLMMNGCASRAVKQAGTTTTAESGSKVIPAESNRRFEDIDPRAFDLYVNGVIYEGIGDLYHAAESYRAALNYHPESCELSLAYAVAAYRTGHAAEAREVLESVCPEDGGVLSFKGLLYRRSGDHAQARNAYTRLTEVDPDNEDAYLYLAGEYQRLNDLDSAVWAMQQLARIRSDNTELLNQLGRLLRFKGDQVGARAAFEHSLLIDHSLGNMAAMLMLSDIYEKANEPDSAAAVFEKAFEWNKGSPQLHREVARIWTERDSTARALPHVKAIAEVEPGDFRNRRQLALIYLTLDSLDQGQRVLEQLVEEEPAEAANRYFLAQVGLQRRDYRKAADEFEQVTRLAGQNPDGWLGLAFCRRRLEQHDREIEAYQNGLIQMRNEDDAVKLYFALGAAYERTDQVDSAISTFEEILRHKPDHVESLNYLGYMLADRNIRLDYAHDLIKKAITQEPHNAAYLDSYGWVYYRLEKYDSALFYLSQAVQLDSDPVIYDHLGDVYQANGDTRKAREWWQKALDQQPTNETIKQKLLEPADEPSKPAQR